MKKLLLFIFIFFSFIGVSNAGRTVEGGTTYIEYPMGATITSCSGSGGIVGNECWGVDEFFQPIIFYSENDLNNICGENIIIEEINPVTDLANDTGSGAITEAGNIINGPLGYFLFFIYGIVIILLVINGIKIFFLLKDKKNSSIKNSGNYIKRNKNKKLKFRSYKNKKINYGNKKTIPKQKYVKMSYEDYETIKKELQNKNK